jgi:hypothetical protein
MLSPHSEMRVEQWSVEYSTTEGLDRKAFRVGHGISCPLDNPPLAPGWASQEGRGSTG